MGDSNLIKLIIHYQQCLTKHSSRNNEEKILYYLSKLYKLPITVDHLQETGVGRTVNALRRMSGDVGDAATSLVSKWKEMINAISDNISSDTSSKSESSKSHKHSKDKYKENSSSSSHKQSDKKQKYENKEKSNSSLHNGYARSKDEIKDKQYVSVDKKYKENNYKHKYSKQSSETDDSDTEKSDYEKQSKYKSEEYHSESDNNEKIRDERNNQTHKSSRKKYSSNDPSTSSTFKTVHALSDSDDDTNNKSEYLKRKHSDNNLNSYSNRKTSKNSYNVSDSDCDTKPTSPKRRYHSESDENYYNKNSECESDKELQDEKIKKLASKSHTKHESSTEVKDRYKKDHKHKHKKEKKEHHSEQRSKKESHSKRKEETSHEDKNKISSKSKHKEDRKSSSSSKHHSKSSSHGKSKISLSESGIGSGSGTSFAEALGMLMPSSSKTSSNKKKVSTTPPMEKSTVEVNDVSPDVTKSKALNLLTEKKLLEPVDIDLSNLLPEITPNYRPLGSYSMDSAYAKNKITAEDEALSAIMNSKISRTKVYSGNKVVWGKVPTLFEIATRVLQDNIDALEYTGGVPYTILKPVIDRATPDQLFMLEHHNPYLIEDTDELWKFHCHKEFRNKQRQEMETCRDMYMRCLDEREAKLKALTANIKQAQDKSLPVRQTKLAYVDSFVKPPRNIARKQAKHGTAGIEKKPLVTPSSRLTSLATAGAAGQIAVPNPAPRSNTSAGSNTIPKMKKAPLMQKTLAFMKNRCFRR